MLVRCLGGLDYWRYGLERLRDVCTERGVKLAVLPGDDRPDERLSAFSTVTPALVDGDSTPISAPVASTTCGRCCDASRRRSAFAAKRPPSCIAARFRLVAANAARSIPQTASAQIHEDAPLAWLIVYRSAILSADTQAIVAFQTPCANADRRPSFLPSRALKMRQEQPVAACVALRKPDIVVTTTAFSAREDASFVLDQADCPVLQISPRVRRAKRGWPPHRGLSGSDMTMQIVLPEFDGRIVAGPIAFKEEPYPDPLLGYIGRRQIAYADGIAQRRRSGAGPGRTSPHHAATRAGSR